MKSLCDDGVVAGLDVEEAFGVAVVGFAGVLKVFER